MLRVFLSRFADAGDDHYDDDDEWWWHRHYIRARVEEWYAGHIRSRKQLLSLDSTAYCIYRPNTKDELCNSPLYSLNHATQWYVVAYCFT